MSYLLDTNVCIAVVNRKPTHVRHRMMEKERSGTSLFVSALTVFEIEVGIQKSDRQIENRQQYGVLLGTLRKLNFDDDDAAVAGAIRADLERRGRPIGAYDYLIAAQALRRDWTLVTANEREFQRVTDLRIENWAR